ncbi:hypothetical protein CLV92_104148 [Kineococcus xinjiangensis]|uniref:NAD(P)-binding domain-containing protein n=1 Tax=Kineococcus xinjiangensis TaxID=512762 RepID=A0A2S6ISV4_9ACTN|nr:NAD(P)H-binding protein [Kineococcus xinjiangensis]PPK97327.1 hypothetical protein CLV92_104148 [Kineococcus xinjiangensis]
MRIAVLGAAGSVGSRVVAEALARRHVVTAAVRRHDQLASLPAAATALVADAADAAAVTALAAGHDVVVLATRPPPGREDEHLRTTAAALAGSAGSGARLLVVGGAATLRVPGAGGRTAGEDPRYVPAQWRPVARASAAQLAACRAARDVDWTYLSPPAVLEPGVRTGRYRRGLDELLVGEDGSSRISVEDLAVALLDELEEPAHRRARFTVAH